MFFRKWRRRPNNVDELIIQLRKHPDTMFVKEDLMAVYYPIEDKVLFFPGNYRGMDTEELNQKLIENIVAYTAVKN